MDMLYDFVGSIFVSDAAVDAFSCGFALSLAVAWLSWFFLELIIQLLDYFFDRLRTKKGLPSWRWVRWVKEVDCNAPPKAE